jgi:hypothetical protein
MLRFAGMDDSYSRRDAPLSGITGVRLGRQAWEFLRHDEAGVSRALPHAWRDGIAGRGNAPRAHSRNGAGLQEVRALPSEGMRFTDCR